MKIIVFTIFPEIIKDFCSQSLLGKALQSSLWDLKVVNFRDYSKDKHKKVDDTPYGGKHGMVIRADVLGDSIEANCDLKKTKIYYMSPRGKKLEQKVIRNIIETQNDFDIAIICGRYEGIDERIIKKYDVEELSIGDFVIMGGELPALIFIEGLIRCIDGVVGDRNSIAEDSFGGITENVFNNLLEYPLYTKPRIWKGMEVPEVLLSGNHKRIEEWKLEEAKKITEKRRKDLLQGDS